VVRIGAHSVRIWCGFRCALQPKSGGISRPPSLSPSYSPLLIPPEGDLRTKRKDATCVSRDPLRVASRSSPVGVCHGSRGASPATADGVKIFTGWCGTKSDAQFFLHRRLSRDSPDPQIAGSPAGAASSVSSKCAPARTLPGTPTQSTAPRPPSRSPYGPRASENRGSLDVLLTLQRTPACLPVERGSVDPDGPGRTVAR
jgi:hypothetical protein